MIHLYLGLTSSQVLPVTSQENLSCGTTCSIAVFHIKNELTRKEKWFIPSDDVSPFVDRINMFEVSIVGTTASENLLNGILYFTQSDIGWWKYKIYQQDCTIPGIDIDKLVLVLETGYLQIIN